MVKTNSIWNGFRARKKSKAMVQMAKATRFLSGARVAAESDSKGRQVKPYVTSRKMESKTAGALPSNSNGPELKVWFVLRVPGLPDGKRGLLIMYAGDWIQLNIIADRMGISTL
jgi:hypothetical protein